MGKLIDLSGKRYGNLLVLEEHRIIKKHTYWKTLCDCGNIVWIKSDSLRNNKRTSCGCKDSLVGQKFGKLTVLEKTNFKTKDGKNIYKCKCECGKEYCTCSTSLRTGVTKECNECSNFKKRKDITGQTFGKLIALYPTDKRDSSRSVIWKCKCSCGNYTEVSVGQLTTKAIQSCGCLKKEAGQKTAKDISGKRYGKLIAVEPTEKRYGNGSVVWKCRCDCGNIVYISVNSLEGNKQKSCGCSHGDIQSFGEKLIEKILNRNNINFKKEYSFNSCINPKTNRKLRFDFYLTDFNCCIEYDGKQHYIETAFCKESLDERRIKDKIKNQYCKEYNIKLIRIPYWDYDRLNEKYIQKSLQCPLMDLSKTF